MGWLAIGSGGRDIVEKRLEKRPDGVLVQKEKYTEIST
jgi:hypothetical protein